MTINAKKYDCLLDTDSEACLLPAEVVSGEIAPLDQRLFAADGTRINIMGVTRVVAEINDRRFEVEGCVSDQITDIILRLNVLRSCDAVWDFGKGVVELQGTRVNCDRETDRRRVGG